MPSTLHTSSRTRVKPTSSASLTVRRAQNTQRDRVLAGETPIGEVITSFRWTDPAALSVVVTGSFDGWLHHRLRKSSSGGGIWTGKVGIRPGVYTFKFLVDGKWRVDPRSGWPVIVDGDGLKVHKLVVAGDEKGGGMKAKGVSMGVGTGMGAGGMGRRMGWRNGAVGRNGGEGCHTETVGVTKLMEGPDRLAMSTGALGACSSEAVSGEDVKKRRSTDFRLMRGRAGSTVRKSLLQRMSSGFMRRLSVKSVSNDDLGKGLSKQGKSIAHSSSYHQRTKFMDGLSKQDRSAGFVKSSSWRSSIRSSPRGSASRASSRRGIAVEVSRPTKVDEPQSVEEVEKQAEGWRDMARHLQEDLKDPNGARELLIRAVQHREKHGRWCTFENAQTHVDLARNLSKSNKLTDAEFHLRIALRVYNQIKTRPEHLGDLLHYIGVVVDRQKRRAEAEELYKKALDVYKDGKLSGDNVDIALKNLSLCLKKQGREAEAKKFVAEYYNVTGKE